MPRRARSTDEEDEEDVSVRQSTTSKPSSSRTSGAVRVKPDPDEDGSPEPPKSKKAKTGKNDDRYSAGDAKIETNAEGDKFIKLTEYRRITVRKFKGKTLVDLRDMYKDKATGEIKPGAKGIALNTEQWEFIRANIANVDDMIASVSEK